MLLLQSRAARIVLKDYVNGKLLFCEAPPGFDQDSYHVHKLEVCPFNLYNIRFILLQVRRVWKDELDRQNEARRLQQIRKTKTEEIDNTFFAGMSLGAHVK